MKPIILKMGAAIALCAVVSSCGDPAGPLPTGVLSVAIDSSAGPIIRVATITLETPAAIRVTYGAPNTPVLTISADSQVAVHRIVLPRLRASSNYRLQVGVSGEPGVHESTFGTGALPPELARIKLETTGIPSLPVALVEIAGTPAGEFAGLLIVERGAIVGYLPVDAALFGMTRRANGDLVLLHSTLGLVSNRLDGSVAHQLPQTAQGRPYGRIHHDAIATPSNTILFIATDTARIDGVLVTGEALWEWSPETGSVTKRWSAFDHLDWRTERGRGSSRSVPGNWLHGNGIQYGPRGNIVMSLRNIHQVISIAPDFKSVEWTLGGQNSTLAVSEADRFYGQHYVSEPQLNRLLVFDNGFERPGCIAYPDPACFTRAIEYAIDPAARTATKVWEYRHSPDIYAAFVGSARRLPNGNTVVLFGMARQAESSGPIKAVEVDQGGAVKWSLVVPNTDVGGNEQGPPSRLYRLTPIASLLGETEGSFQ